MSKRFGNLPVDAISTEIQIPVLAVIDDPIHCSDSIILVPYRNPHQFAKGHLEWLIGHVELVVV